MLRILYNLPTIETTDEIAINNITLSIKHFNLETLYHSSIGWILNDTSRTFQDLELLYRKLNVNAYLISIHKIPDELKNDKYFFKQYNDTKNEIKYLCECVIEREEIALTLIYKQWLNYEENFENLKYSGHIDIHNKDEVKEDEMFEKLKNNQIVLEFKSLNPKESIEQLNKDIFNFTKEKPEISIVGKYDEDSPIMCFKNKKGELLSNIGWVIQNKDNNMEYTLIDLNEHLYK